MQQETMAIVANASSLANVTNTIMLIIMAFAIGSVLSVIVYRALSSLDHKQAPQSKSVRVQSGTQEFSQ